MKAFIKKISIFDQNNNTREVELTTGLNIITGDSKTGKSALLEIVDYCLFSSRSTIPKGIIDDFGQLYSIILKLSEFYIVIARPSYKTGNGGKAYVKVETDDTFLNSFSLSYFDSIKAKPLKEAQAEVEKHLGISVNDTRLDDEEDKRNAGKASLRSFIPFLFQHQNLIANKHSIFYRFDEFYKRKKTIDDFPILIGWESSEYFMYSRELELKKKELKQLEKEERESKLSESDLSKKLYSIVSKYYTAIGLKLDSEISVSELKKLAKNLPDYKEKYFSNSNIPEEIKQKKSTRDTLKTALDEVTRLLSSLESNISTGSQYKAHLAQVEFSLSTPTYAHDASCPVCDNKNPNFLSDKFNPEHSRISLLAELAKFTSYEEDNTSQISELQAKRNSIKVEINHISSAITALENQNKEIKEHQQLRDFSLIAKGMAISSIDILLSTKHRKIKNQEKEEIIERIKWLTEKLDGFDLKSKIANAEQLLSKIMTKVCNRLDFEEELKPGTLHFSLTDFTFHYNHDNKDKIYLSEMGSGANWLACHLSIFLAFLYLSCKENNSKIPTILMIDQPSQVYFPTQYRNNDDLTAQEIDENILQVKNIFNVLEVFISSIQKRFNIEPQIIVLEHADEPEFDQHVKARWKKDGRKLI